MKRQQSVRRLAQAVGGLLLVGSQDRAGSVGRDGTAVVRQLGHSGITLDDLEAIGAARARALEAVRVLREHKLRRAPAGGVRAHTLVVGPRGCGKSLLAQAIAGQAGVPLFWLAGREVTKLPIGRAAAAVADLFARAVTSAPCLVLIEDLDVVAQADRGRGAELAGAPVVLKQILAELDRLGRSDVVVFGTACEPDVLEEAVRGPGRFERQATLERPDQLGRFQILRLHTSAMKLADDVDLQALAGRTFGAVRADLARLVREASGLAVLDGRDTLTRADFDAALERMSAAGVPGSWGVDPGERELRAYHEAGHAVVALLRDHVAPFERVSILPSDPGAAAASPWALRQNGRLHTRRDLLARVDVLLGGRIAEELVLGDSSTASGDDLAQATALARAMVTRYGMDAAVGLASLHEAEIAAERDGAAAAVGLPSEETRRLVDRQIRRLLDEAHTRVRDELAAHRPDLNAVGRLLLKVERVERKAVQALVELGDP